MGCSWSYYFIWIFMVLFFNHHKSSSVTVTESQTLRYQMKPLHTHLDSFKDVQWFNTQVNTEELSFTIQITKHQENEDFDVSRLMSRLVKHLLRAFMAALRLLWIFTVMNFDHRSDQNPQACTRGLSWSAGRFSWRSCCSEDEPFRFE